MGYYSEKLSGHRLLECYEIAPPRVQQYLDAEIRHVLKHIKPGDAVLELGCGYGRVAIELSKAAHRVVGIDTSAENIELAREFACSGTNLEFFVMDAGNIRFPDREFDIVACIQNGICVFGIDRLRLIRGMIRVTRPGGRGFLSSYTEDFWAHRLDWFEIQAERGLLGEIDYKETRDGVIVCKDGFHAGAMGREEFRTLCEETGVVPHIEEVDGSSIFCEFTVEFEEG